MKALLKKLKNAVMYVECFFMIVFSPDRRYKNVYVETPPSGKLLEVDPADGSDSFIAFRRMFGKQWIGEKNGETFTKTICAMDLWRRL